jgi:hypothetical protein
MKKYLIPILICITFSLAAKNCAAQTFQNQDIFAFWKDSGKLVLQILKKNDFKLVYKGGRKSGGMIALYQNKTAQEYLFIYDTGAQGAPPQSISYYVPAKEKYQRLINLAKKSLLSGEKVIPNGRTTYEDGKKYYQVTYICNY